jgi:hypothetical protein
MHKGDPVAAAGRRWISADRRKRDSTKSGATQAQARAKLLRLGAALGFGVRQAVGAPAAPGALRRNRSSSR